MAVTNGQCNEALHVQRERSHGRLRPLYAARGRDGAEGKTASQETNAGWDGHPNLKQPIHQPSAIVFMMGVGGPACLDEMLARYGSILEDFKAIGVWENGSQAPSNERISAS